MPKIPTYKRTESIPAISGGTPFSAQDNRGTALSQIGSAVANTGLRLDNVFDRLQAKRDNIDFNNAKNQFEEFATKDHIEFQKKKGKDAENSQTYLDDLQKKSVQDFVETTKNKRIKEPLRNYIQERINSRREIYARKEDEELQNATNSSLKNTLENLAESSFNQSSSLPENITSWENTVARQKELGQVEENQAESMIMLGRKQIAERHVSGLIDKSPENAIMVLDDPQILKYLDSKDVERFRKVAKEESKNKMLLEKANADAENKAIIASAEKALSDAHLSNDYDSMTLLLGQYGDRLSAVGKYDTWNKRKASLLKGGSGLTEKERKVNENKLFVEAVTDPEIFTSDGLDKHYDKMINAIGKEIDFGDYERLVGGIQDFLKRSTSDTGKKLGIQLATKTFQAAHKDGLLGKDTDGDLELHKMVRDLHIWVAENPDKDPADFTESILKPKRDGWIKRLFTSTPSYEPKDIRESLMKKSGKSKQSLEEIFLSE